VRNLFVHGARLDGELRARLIGRAPAWIPATLHGYIRRRGRYYHIVAEAGGEVAGLVLTCIAAPELALLDIYEEVPKLYTRELVTVRTGAGMPLAAWCYLPAGAGRVD
jgi:hypothetical protein